VSNNKVEDKNSMRRGPSRKQIGYHYLMDNSNISLNFKNFSKVQNGLESKLYKLYFVSLAQVQWMSYLWLKLSFSK
jgi:hypothetical protein